MMSDHLDVIANFESSDWGLKSVWRPNFSGKLRNFKARPPGWGAAEAEGPSASTELHPVYRTGISDRDFLRTWGPEAGG
jgi:hypothetical protein